MPPCMPSSGVMTPCCATAHTRGGAATECKHLSHCILRWVGAHAESPSLRLFPQLKESGVLPGDEGLAAESRSRANGHATPSALALLLAGHIPNLGGT